MSSLRKHVGLYALLTLLLSLFVGLVAVQPTHAAPAVSGPVAKVGYLPEGRIGGGFRQWLTLGNPSSSDCSVKIDYYYTLDNSGVNSTKSVTLNVKAETRATSYVNNMLGIAPDAAVGATLSAIVSIDGATPTCPGVVIERPMYFDSFHGVSSGTDVMGSSQLSTQFYYADVPGGSAGSSFISVLNPGTLAAQVTAQYYAGGSQVKTVSLSVPPKSRGTFQPASNIPAHTAVVLSSDRPIASERASYFTSSYGVKGSAAITGVAGLGDTWLFAEGLTSSGTQENLSIANMSDTDANITITLKSLSGAKQDYTAKITAHDLLIWDVNQRNTFAGSTPEVAAEIRSDGKNIVAQRQLFTTYNGAGFTAQGVTDTFGQTAAKAFSFAEGFTSTGFSEQLALQNPADQPINVTVTLTNMLSRSATKTFTIGAQSRYTVDVNSLVADNLVEAGDGTNAYAVSMSVTSDSTFAAERTMHWAAFGTQGGSSIAGYAG